MHYYFLRMKNYLHNSKKEEGTIVEILINNSQKWKSFLEFAVTVLNILIFFYKSISK